MTSLVSRSAFLPLPVRPPRDSAELYWQWAGTGWDVPTDRLVAEVTLPAASEPLVAGENLLIWACGHLQGTVEQVGSDTVCTAVDGVPASTFVELRELLPAARRCWPRRDCLGGQADAPRRGGRVGSTSGCRPGAGRWRAIGAGLLAAVAAAWGASLTWKVRVTHPFARRPAGGDGTARGPPAGSVRRDAPAPTAIARV